MMMKTVILLMFLPSVKLLQSVPVHPWSILPKIFQLHLPVNRRRRRARRKRNQPRSRRHPNLRRESVEIPMSIQRVNWMILSMILKRPFLNLINRFKQRRYRIPSPFSVTRRKKRVDDHNHSSHSRRISPLVSLSQ